jgi:hypothetical protein
MINAKYKFYFLFIKTAPENPVLWTEEKGASAESRKKVNQMLKQVQHDMTVRFYSFCHPEPGPELDSGSIDFSISVSGLRIYVLKPRPVGGVLYFEFCNLQFSICIVF